MFMAKFDWQGGIATFAIKSGLKLWHVCEPAGPLSSDAPLVVLPEALAEGTLITDNK